MPTPSPDPATTASAAACLPPSDRAWLVDAALLTAAAIGGLILVSAALGVLPGGLVITRHLPHGDLLVHALVYGTLTAALAILSPRATIAIGPRRCPVAILVMVPIALGEEALQLRDPARTSSFFDGAADVLGIVVGAPILLHVRGRARAWLRRSCPAAPAGR